MLNIGRYLKAQELYIVFGAILASALNFYSFVIAPTFFAISHFGHFVADSYLSGFYMAGVVSSIMPFSVYLYQSGGHSALRHYLYISLGACIFISIFGISFARFPESYMMIIAVVLMQVAGFYMGALIHKERISLVAKLQSLQPFIFACFITLNQILEGAPFTWSLLYLLSVTFAVLIFIATADHAQIKIDIASVKASARSKLQTSTLIVATISFPMFLHFEIFLVGNFGLVVLGEYAILQKFYASITTSLFGSIGILILSRSLEKKNTEIHSLPKEVIAFACLASVIVPAVSSILSIYDQATVFTIPVILHCSFLAFLYTLCSYSALRLSVIYPTKCIQILCVSSLFYAAAFVLIRPTNNIQYLQISSVFFFTFLIFSNSKNLFKKRGIR